MNVRGPTGRPPTFATTWAFSILRVKGKRCQGLRYHGPDLWLTWMMVRQVGGFWCPERSGPRSNGYRRPEKLHGLVLASEWVNHKMLIEKARFSGLRGSHI
jgi:hypothetical protein